MFVGNCCHHFEGGRSEQRGEGSVQEGGGSEWVEAVNVLFVIQFPPQITPTAMFSPHVLEQLYLFWLAALVVCSLKVVHAIRPKRRYLSTRTL